MDDNLRKRILRERAEEYNLDNLKTVYFSHPMSHYNSDFEMECIEIIVNMLTPVEFSTEIPESYLIEIMNPNQKWLSDLYKNRLKDGIKDTDAFEIFREIAKACDIVVGVTFFDGSIGAGVAEECKVAQENGKEVYLIYVHEGKKLFMPFTGFANYKVLSRDDTRQRRIDGVM